MRRITKMCIPDAHSLITQAMSAGIRHHEINAIVTPNYGNADRGVFAGFRQSGKSGTMSELFKPYLEFKYDDAIRAEHEQYFAVFNQIRGSRLEPRIELKIGNKYEIQLGENTKHLYLSRIVGDINYMPELYFSVHEQPKSGTNISVFKILREIK